MDFFEKHNLSLSKVLKIFGIALLAIVVIGLALQLVGGMMYSFRSGGVMSDSWGGEGQKYAMEATGNMAYSDSDISLRNVAGESYSPGMDLEDFEITEYSARIETRKLDTTCEAIILLKQREDVVFENSNKSDNSCNYRFKVKRESADDVLEDIRKYKPRELNENIKTIKKQIDDYTSQEEILKRKLESIDETLGSAIVSYDEISKLATQTRDAESLASIITSKVEIIERLTKEKINITSELERISRSKAEKLDKLEYTYFNVYIYENKYVDVDQIKDSWKRSIKNFVVNMNKVAQDLSVGLVALIVYTFQYLLYILIIVVVAKYVWKLFKRIWAN